MARRDAPLLDDFSWDCVIVDVTDVIKHFERTARVSGIQRVVVQLALALFEVGAGASTFDERTGQWWTVDTAALVRMFEASRSTASGAPDWLETVAQVHGTAHIPTHFPQGALLLGLGANWDVDRLFMSVRQLQATLGLTYAVMVHDTVPFKLPEVTAPSTVRTYKRWLAASVENADVLITTSSAVTQELALACAQLGLLPRASVECPLVGALDQGAASGRCAVRSDIAEVLNRGFVLFVGTIEPRKDHLFVMNCWRALVSQLGIDQTPTLVIVGSLGWRYEPVLMAMEDPVLNSSVRIFDDLSDEDLVRLYDRCLFTVYNSLHEGWGLPVTESVGRGRVPLIPQHSGLLDSGAGTAVYFSPGSAADFIAKAARLIVDPAFRAECEGRLLAHRRLKPWAEIAEALCRDVAGAVRKPRRPLSIGKIHAFTSELDRQDLGRYAHAEALRFSGFHHLEHWGVWTSALDFTLSGQVTPDVQVRIHPQHTRHSLMAYLLVKVSFSRSKLTIFVNLRRSRSDVELEPGRFCLKVPVILRDSTGEFTLSIRQSHLNDVSATGDARSIGVGLEAFMLCHPSDASARMDFLEHVSGYRVVPV